MPSYRWLNRAEIAPRKKPWTSAYSGAVTGAQVFLNAVTRASTRPPIAPPQTYTEKPGAGVPSGPKAWFQAKVAVSTMSSSRTPVLLTVPLSDIVSPSRETTAPLPRSRKVDSLSTGLPLRMDALFRWSWSRCQDTRAIAVRDLSAAVRVDTGRHAPDNGRSAGLVPGLGLDRLPVIGRGIAQSGSAPALGAGCRGFESLYPDHPAPSGGYHARMRP